MTNDPDLSCGRCGAPIPPKPSDAPGQVFGTDEFGFICRACAEELIPAAVEQAKMMDALFRQGKKSSE